MSSQWRGFGTERKTRLKLVLALGSTAAFGFLWALLNGAHPAAAPSDLAPGPPMGTAPTTSPGGSAGLSSATPSATSALGAATIVPIPTRARTSRGS